MSFITTPGDGRLAILKILNIISDKNYTLDDVTFSAPTPNTDVTKNRNTKVTVTFKSERGNYGVKDIYYNRIHINDLPVLTVNRGSATTYHQLIPALNTAFNLNITTQDIDNGPLPDIVSSSVTITLPVANNSYLYYDTAAISTVGFNPSYDIFKPSHTLLNYVCNGFDRYGEYSDNDGGVYLKLLQTNSPDCGFEDGLPRIELTNPVSMSVLEEANSGVFTLELVNPDTPVTVTLTSPGLTFSSNNIVLNSTTPTATFTVSSNNPGQYQIVVTNNAGISNPINRYFTIIDKYNTTYSVTQPAELESIAGINSQTFTIQGLNIDPDEPVTVNINTTGDLDPSVSSVVLTSAQPSATFTVSSLVSGVYFITFTNNRGLINPNQIAFLVRPELSLILTPPSSPVVDGWQSGLFTVTLINGYEDVTVTPQAPGATIISPSSFILTPEEPNGSFRLTYNGVGPYNLDLTNNGGVPNPPTYEVNVLPTPYITVSPPASPIYTGQVSGNFTIQLFNALEPVTVTITYNTDSISTTTVNLNPASPIATFTLLEAQEGNYTLSFSNNRGYSITSSLNITVNRTLVPEIVLEGPASLDLEVGQESGNFTLSLIDHAGPVTVTIGTSSGLTSSVPNVILDSENPIANFTVTASTNGSKTVSVTNNAGIPNPGNIIFNVRLPDFVELTTVPSTIRANTLTDNFLVTLQNPNVAVTVTPSTENGSFTPSSVILTAGQPTATFRGTFTQEGPATVSLGTSPSTPTSEPANITVLELIEPELTLTGPSGILYPGDQSGNFTITLLNGQSSVLVTVVSETDSTSILSATLTPVSPTATFTVADTQAGTYNVSITNNASIPNPAAVPITVTADPGSLQFTGPGILESEAGQASGNFTVTGVNLVRSVLIVPETTGNKTFTPESFTLTPAQPSATFTINSTDIGIKSVSLTNNRGYTNPTPIDYEFLTPTFPYLTLNGPVSSSVFVNDETGDFTITLNNPEDPVDVNVVVIKNSIDVTSQVLADSTYTLSAGTPTATFKLLPTTDGVFEVSITNTQSIQVPPTPINITASYNTVITLQLLGSSVSATCAEDTNYTLSIIRNHNSGNTIVNLPVIPGVTFEFSQITITNGNTTFPVNVSFSDIGLYEIYATYGSSIQTNIIDVEAVIKPTYTVTPNGSLDIEEDSTPTVFTVTGTNLLVPVTVTITAWSTSGLNTSSVTITPGDPVETFTIAPTNPGVFSLSFTNNGSLTNPANIDIEVLPKPSLLLTRVGSGNITREEEVTFTVTLQNGTAPVEITPVTDLEVVVGGYTPPMVLTPASPTGTFTVNSDTPGTYSIAISNNAGITNPTPISLTVINGVINITVVSTNLEVGVESDTIIVELQDYDLPTVVTLSLDNFTDGTLTIDPSDEFSSNQILLNSSNPTGLFTISKASVGTVNLTITNNKGLANPNPVAFSFFDEPMYIVLSPLIERDLVNQAIGPYTVTGQSIAEPISDKLHADPYKANVVLFLDFYDPIGTVITDKSPYANTVSVFGSAQIDSFSPIYGDRGYLAPTANGEYLSVPNTGNIFDFPGDFTIEIDLVRTNGGSEILIDRWYSSVPNKFLFGFDSSNILYWNSDGTTYTCTTPITTSSGITKIAVSRIGTDLRIFINGKLDGQFTDSVAYAPDPAFAPVLGIFGRVNQRVTTSDFTGRAGKVKITKGVGRYSGNYTPESLNPKPNITVFPIHDKLGNDTYKDNTVLYLDFSDRDGTKFIDYSQYNNEVKAFGSANLSTTNPIYFNTVGLFDGSGDYLSVSDNVTNYHFPGDFTIEVDFLPNSVSRKSLIDFYKANITGYYHLWMNIDGKLEWITYDGTDVIRRVSTTTIAVGTLYKVAISRNSGIFRMFINGNLELEVADTINYSPSTAEIPQIGIAAQVTTRNGTYDFNGRIGKVKITKGIGRYTSNYIPESLPNVTYSPTTLELTVAQPSQQFNVGTNIPAVVVTKFINYDNLPNPPVKTSIFEILPTISLNVPSVNLIAGQPTDNITLTLVNATSPVEITFNLPAGLAFSDAPIGMVGNKITLDENNTNAVFTLISSVNGTLPFSVSNNKSLTNPNTVNFASLYLTTLTKTEPVNKRVFIRDTIPDYSLSISNINEPTTVHTYVDNLVGDPYANNVSLLLDFVGVPGDTSIVDYSPRRKILTFGPNFNLDYSGPDQIETAMVGVNNQNYLSVRQVDNVDTYTDLVFGTEDFTIELELLLNTSETNSYLIESRISSPSSGFMVYITPAGYLYWGSLGVWALQSLTPINDGVKHHIAISRVGGQSYLLIDGVVHTSVANTADYSQVTTQFAIGKLLNYITDGALFTGRLCSLKITKGVGRYSANTTIEGMKKLKVTPFRRTFTENAQSQAFVFQATKIDTYPILAYSDKQAVTPAVTVLEFEKLSSIAIVEPSSKVNLTGEVSSQYRINLIDPSIPVKITINLQSGLSFSTGPTNLTGVNEITLDENNTFSVFTVTSAVAGSYSISFTNDSGLTNPNSLIHSFIEEGVDPPVVNENDLKLNLNKPDDTIHSLNIFQSII